MAPKIDATVSFYGEPDEPTRIQRAWAVVKFIASQAHTAYWSALAVAIVLVSL